MTDFKRGAIVEPVSDCKFKNKRCLIMDCDTLLKRSLVHCISMNQRAWIKWDNLKLLQSSIERIASDAHQLRLYPLFGK